MTAEHASLTTPAATRPSFVQALRFVAPLVSLVILVQAFFAGRGLFLDNDLIDVHGGIGMLTALLVIVQAALVLLAGVRGSTRTPLLITSLLLVVLVIVQMVLGYSGDEGGQAAAWHVPTGVAIFGLSVGINTLVDRYRRDSAT